MITKWIMICLCFFIASTFEGYAQDEFPELLQHHVIVVQWDSHGTRYATGHVNGDIKVYENIILQTTIQSSHSNLLNSISFSPDGNRFVTGSYDNSVKIWNTSVGTMIMEFPNIIDTLENVHWSQDGTTIVTMGLGEDQFISADPINDIYTISLNTQIGSTYDVAYNPDNTLIAVSSSINDLLILDELDKSIVRKLDATPNTNAIDVPNEFTMRLAWHPTANIVANGKVNGWIHVWDLDSSSDNVPIMSLQANIGATDDAVIPFEYKVEDITFNIDGSTISSISSDGTFRTWDSQTGALVTDTNLGEAILSAAFSPDGSKLVYNTYSEAEAPPILVNINDLSSYTTIHASDVTEADSEDIIPTCTDENR